LLWILHCTDDSEGMFEVENKHKHRTFEKKLRNNGQRGSPMRKRKKVCVTV